MRTPAAELSTTTEPPARAGSAVGGGAAPSAARAVVRPVAPPARPKEASPPRAFPWATPLLLGLLFGAMWLYSSKGPDVYDAAAITGFHAAQTSSWFRLIAGLFVHGKNHEFQALTVILVVAYNGFLSERALGAGGMLLCFLLGGVGGNLVRAFAEPSMLIKVSAATTAGALALIGASVSASVRSRQQPFVPALLSALGSAVVTTVFSGGAQQGAFRFLPQMLPGAGTAFVIGGFAGAVLPLYDPTKRRALRGVLLAIALGVLAYAGASYYREIRPLVHPTSPQAEKHRLDEPDLETTWDPHLEKYEFGLPISHRRQAPDDPKERKDLVLLVPYIVSLPVIRITSRPRDPRLSVDGVAFEIAYSFRKEYPDSKPLDEGWIEGCQLGKAYRHVIRVNVGQRAFDFFICVVESEDDDVCVIVQAEPDDQEASVLANAIARSLKVHSAPTDKKDGGRAR